MYLSVKITNILNNQKFEILKDMKDVETVRAEINLDETKRSEISETEYSNLETGDNKQLLGKFEMIELHVKKEINDEIIMEDLGDSNLTEDGIPNYSEIHKIKIEEREDGHIPSSDSIEIVKITDILNNQKCEIFQDIQNVGKVKVEANLDEAIKSEISETEYSNLETGNNEQILGKFEMIEMNVKTEITEEVIMEDLEDSNLTEDGVPDYSEIKIEERYGHIPSSDSIENDSESFYSDTDSSDRGKRIDEKRHKCDVCQKAFKKLSHLKIHYRIHTGDKPFTCEICQRSFRVLSDMKRHELTHTDNKPYKCEICQKSFRQLTHMKIHKRIHTGERPYLCKVCQKSFRQICAMKRHELIHTNEHPHTCKICQKSFREFSVMKQHELIHTGAKTYLCDICQKSFHTAAYLRRHRYTHTDNKPHICEFCQKTFRNLSNMKVHQRTHTNEKPYTCDICQKSFSDPSSMIRHKRTHSNTIA